MLAYALRLAYARAMHRPDHYAPGKTVAAAMRITQDHLKQGVIRQLPAPLRINIDAQREARLTGMAEGLLPTVREARMFERRVADIRQAAGTSVSFRQSLWLLMRVQGIDPMRRAELMRRAMAWFRARGVADGNIGSPWAKSMVAIAQAQEGKL